MAPGRTLWLLGAGEPGRSTAARLRGSHVGRGYSRPQGRRRWALAAVVQARRHYLEITELDWDWLEEVVTALSCEKPLWLDSRLLMEPLKSSEPMTSV